MEGGLLSLKWNNHRSSFIHVLSLLRKKDSFCDVTLACEGKFYPSHKLVLSTCSEYFQEMFQHTQCKHPVIVLKDIHCDDLEALLNYMYLGEVNVLQEKLSTLINAAECLKIKGLAVPDDPPRDASSEKRSTGHHDSGLESKRRRTESDHRNKDSSRSYSKHSIKSSEILYRQSGTNQDNFNSSSGQSEVDIDSGNYSFDNGNSSNALKSKGRDGNFIKQEPPDDDDDDIDIEDSKEGLLQTGDTGFLSPLPQEEISNTEIMGTSDSQEIWGSESRSEDGYPPMEGGDSGEGVNEDGSQNETVSTGGEAYDPFSNTNFFQSRETSTNFYDPSVDQLNLPSGPTSDVPHLYNPSPDSSERPTFSCPICSYVGFQKSNLVKHLVIHSGQKPYACPHCSYRSAQKGNVRTHHKRMHPMHPVTKL